MKKKPCTDTIREMISIIHLENVPEWYSDGTEIEIVEWIEKSDGFYVAKLSPKGSDAKQWHLWFSDLTLNRGIEITREKRIRDIGL